MDVQNPPDEVIRSILEQYRHVAVVGLSDRPDRPSYGVAAYLQRAGYTITPVNPTIRETLGVAAVPSLEEAPPPLEIVDVFRRPEHVPAVVDQAIALGAKVVWLQLGIVDEAAAATARAAGMTVVQDRCIYREHQRLFGARAPASS